MSGDNEKLYIPDEYVEKVRKLAKKQGQSEAAMWVKVIDAGVATVELEFEEPGVGSGPAAAWVGEHDD